MSANLEKSSPTDQNPEIAMLRETLTSQVNRLFDQLEDLELLKSELTEQEYQDEYNDTVKEIEEFNAFLQQSLSLSTQFTLAQQAMQATLKAMRTSNDSSNTADAHRMFRMLATSGAGDNKGNEELISKFMELDLSNVENNKKVNELMNTLSSQNKQ